MQKTLNVTNAAETEELAVRIGSKLRGGETIELSSDLGGGKTTFVRGLARGAGSEDRVSSPTFTISNAYETPHFTIYHFDFYRLPQAGLIEHQLHENVDADKDVTVVEWSNVVAHVLPEERLSISIAPTGDESRQVTIHAPKSMEYLISDVDSNDKN